MLKSSTLWQNSPRHRCNRTQGYHRLFFIRAGYFLPVYHVSEVGPHYQLYIHLPVFLDYELFACISCLPAEKEWLRIRVELELIRLLDWSDIMGIVQQDSTLTLDFRVYQPTILNILVQQRSILYMLREDLFSASTDGMDSSTNRAGGAHLRYFPEGSHTLLEKVLLDPTEGGLHHFVRNHDCSSFEVAKLEASLPKLIELNDSLRNQMDGPLWGILQQREEQTNLELLQLYNNTEVLANLEWALSIDTKGGHQTIDDANLPGLRDKSALIQFIRFKAYNAKVEIINADEKSQRFFSVEAGAGTVDELLLDRDDFTFSQERSLDHERSEAFYCPSGQPGQRVWIEWKEYDGIPPKFGPNPAVLRRVQELAALLHYDNRPRDLGTARCLGYFINDFEAMDEGMETETCFGLAFERPPEAPVDGELIPLWELYESHSKPSATTRIELAKTIANCILYLHSTNWLHKGLTSKVILYFEEPGKPLDYKGSYLSGFDYARPAASEEMTENPPEDPTIDIYRHPSTHGAAPRTNYMKTFDIYSLGIILVEIAHWQSIDKVMGIPDLVTARPQVIHKTRRRLLNETQFLDNISGALGETYKEVVRTCLIGPTAFDLYETARQHDGRVGAKLIGEYFTKVVQRLRGITNL